MSVTADRTERAARLRDDVLAYLAGRPGQWATRDDLLPLAPQSRITGSEWDGETAFGFDDARGTAWDEGPSGEPDGWDEGPSGEPDGRMLAAVLGALVGPEMLLEETLAAPDGPRRWRLLDLDAPVGAGEIAAWLRVRRDTVDKWRQRDIFPGPEPTAVGGRPWWRRRAVRDWAIATGRAPGRAQ